MAVGPHNKRRGAFRFVMARRLHPRSGLRALCVGAMAATLGACAASVPVEPVAAPDELAAVEAALQRDIEILASDEFGGRLPGSGGETKTLQFMIGEWMAAGVLSGTNIPASEWYAPVTLNRAVPQDQGFRITRAGRTVALPDGSLALYTPGRRALVNDAPVIYVGLLGPQLDRAAIAGRIVIMASGHPGVQAQREALLEKGAAALLYAVPSQRLFDQLTSGQAQGRYRLDDAKDTSLQGFIAPAALEMLVGAQRLKETEAMEDSGTFRPVSLNIRATLEAVSEFETLNTYNIIGRIPGRLPNAGALLLSAHWDHLGECGAQTDADRICNGAVDNASGLAVLNEIARRLSRGPQLDRDVYLLATTAEEWGLLGMEAFIDNPPLPLEQIVLAMNLDTVAIADADSKIGIIGLGRTPFDSVIEEELAAMGIVAGDPQIAEQYLRRQDGWALMRADVPTVNLSSTYGDKALLSRYVGSHYHSAADEADGIELGGAARDLMLHLRIIARLGNVATHPGGE